MKNTLLIIALFIGIGAFAQTTESKNTPPEPGTLVETQPEFPGGQMEMMRFIQKEVKYPEDAKEMGIQGKVYISFTVNKEGTLEEVKILRGVSTSIDKESLRVVKAMPKWTPGTQQGVNVKVRYNLPINFRLD